MIPFGKMNMYILVLLTNQILICHQFGSQLHKSTRLEIIFLAQTGLSQEANIQSFLKFCTRCSHEYIIYGFNKPYIITVCYKGNQFCLQVYQKAPEKVFDLYLGTYRQICTFFKTAIFRALFCI